MLTLPGKSIFSPPKPPAPVAPPPVVTREDPAIAEAQKKLKDSEAKRKGRAASILTGGQGVTDDLGNVTQTAARGGATVLGGSA